MTTSTRKNQTTPRGYLSWSQLNCLEKDPNEYYQRYAEGLEMPRTPYLELGKRLATALEDGGDEYGNPMINHLVLFMPYNIGKREVEITADFEGIPLKGVLDLFHEKSLVFRECKSGKHWTQSMVDRHGQLTFYQLLIYLKYGKFANPIYLDWAETKEEDGELSFTGKIQTFKTERGLKDLILMGGRVHKAWDSIEEMWRTMK